MSDAVTRLAAAEIEAGAARERLSGTLATLQERLAPRRLAREARREIVDAGGVAAQRTAAAVRRRPGGLAGAVALAGLFLARHRIVSLLSRPKRKATRSGDKR